jgi:tellurite resistance protein TerC
LKHGVSFILFFIGMKMMLCFIPAVEHFFKAYSWVSLAVIVGTLALSVVLSAMFKEKTDEAAVAE